MENSRYIAHISNDGREQTVLEHLEGTAKLCAGFASAFGAEEQGYLAGIAHDLGKYSNAFQQRIHGSSEKVDHSTAGAVECAKLKQNCAAFAVIGHHSGLPNGGSQSDYQGTPSFLGRIKKQLPSYEVWQNELTLPKAALPPVSGTDEIMFYIRMLYSCLVDADFLDTEAFMTRGTAKRGVYDGIELLDKKLQEHVSRRFQPDNELNNERCKVLRHCIEQGHYMKPGLFTLTVPTGGGKTVASLAFALRHARSHGLHRIIYVIPYTSIIDQNSQVFRDILGNQNVLEHHSNFMYDIKDEAKPENFRMALATENWDMPVIVTTAVQFFESLFSNRPSQCRKLHNLAQSVIIFDEAQMMPVSCLQPCVFAISQLVKNYGVSAVLCTATQPALDDIFRKFLPGHPPVELCPQEVFHSNVFRRVTFRQAGRLSWESLADEMMGQRQVLCVVNSRKNAQNLRNHLRGEGVFHLSTLMCPAHRNAVIAEIKRRLDNGKKCPENPPVCRVVSTSLIEAGVDVDFPVVFREEAGLDSILQAAGRCNREGQRPIEESIVTVFSSESPIPRLFEKNIAAGQRALRSHGDPGSPEAVSQYFRELRSFIGEERQDKNDILEIMKQDFLPFKKVSQEFHIIDKETKTVYIPIGSGKELTERLYSGERSRMLLRELGQYSVSIYRNHFEALIEAGALDLLEDNSAILSNLNLYNENTGLSIELESEAAT